MTTPHDGRDAYLTLLASAAFEIDYARKEFDRQRAQLARRAQQMAEAPTRGAMSDLAFVQAYVDQAAEAKDRLSVAIEKLKTLHHVGREALALTAAEFAAATRLDADTYEKAATS